MQKNINIKIKISFYLLFHILLCCINNTYANNSDSIKHRQIRLLYENSSGEKGITTYIYSENGLMENAIWL